VRRFIFLFLFSLPLVLLGQLPHTTQILWAVPLLTLLVAYPFVAIDKIGHELQHPFEVHRLNHLPLDEITATIERNVLAILDPYGLPHDDGVLVADLPLLPAKPR
jgi:putative membrane protein